jgi:hypothetical protein
VPTARRAEPKTAPRAWCYVLAGVLLVASAYLADATSTDFGATALGRAVD